MTLPYGLLAQNPQLARLLMLGHGQIPPGLEEPSPTNLMSSAPQPQSRLAMPFPNQSPVAQPPQPGIFDRIQNRLFPEPEGLQGLLGPQDSKAARRQGLLALAASLLESGGPVVGAPAPTLGQAIGRGIPRGQEAFQASIANALGATQYRQQQGALQTAAAEKARVDAARARIEAKYPPAPNETPEQTARRLYSMYGEYVRSGDQEMAGKVGEVLKSQTELLRPPLTKRTIATTTTGTGPGSERIYYYTDTGEEVKREPMHPAVQQTAQMRPQVRSVLGPDGQNQMALIDSEGVHFLGVPAPATESMRGAAADLPALQSAVTDIKRITDPEKGPQKGVSFLDYGLSHVGVMGNPLKSKEYQEYEQALNEFISLYPFSKGGKQLTQAEMEAVLNSLKIKPGDNAATKARKRASFDLRVKEITQRAGGAVPQTQLTPAQKAAQDYLKRNP